MEFKVAAALLGNLKGSHVQYIRPDTISASDSDIDRLFQTTKGFTSINASTIGRSNLISPTSSTSVNARIPNSKWGHDRSIGSLIVDVQNGGIVDRYNVRFYVSRKAIHNGEIDDNAVLTLNSSTKVKISKSGLSGVQSDIIQRMLPDGASGSIIPNRVIDRIGATSRAKEGSLNINIGAANLKSSCHLGAASTLLSTDSLATTLSALDSACRTRGPRASTMRTNEDKTLETICEGAEHYVAENDRMDNDLISFITDRNNGSEESFSISIGALKNLLGDFDFDIFTTDMGNEDFTKTSELNTINGGIAQHIGTQVLGIMNTRNINNIRFYATNESGKIEMLVKENWIMPIRTDDIKGMDKESYIRQLLQLERTVRSEIETLILPKVLNRANTSIIVDISMLTVMTIKVSTSGNTDLYNIPAAISSGWSTINIGTNQMSTQAMQHKSLLKAMAKNVTDQSVNHL